MEETNFVLLWKEQYEKIDQSLQISKRLLRENITGKAESTRRSLVRSKAAGIVIAVVYLILLGIVLFYAIAHYSRAANYFIISIGAIFLINIKALFDYIRHLVWANNIDYNGSIVGIQQQLTRLQLSIVSHIRVTFLQFPFWTTFFLSSSWFPSGTTTGFIILQCVITASFIYLAYFFYKNLTLDNLHKKWVKAILSGAGGKKVMRVVSFYKELESFKD